MHYYIQLTNKIEYIWYTVWCFAICDTVKQLELIYIFITLYPCVFIRRTFRISSIINFQVHSRLWITAVTVQYDRSLELSPVWPKLGALGLRLPLPLGPHNHLALCFNQVQQLWLFWALCLKRHLPSSPLVHRTASLPSQPPYFSYSFSLCTCSLSPSLFSPTPFSPSLIVLIISWSFSSKSQ